MLVGGLGVGSIAWDITRGREREAWGPYLFGIKKCRGNEMQKCRDGREEACCGEVGGYVGSFESWLSHNLLILASLSNTEVKLVAAMEVRSAIKPAYVSSYTFIQDMRYSLELTLSNPSSLAFQTSSAAPLLASPIIHLAQIPRVVLNVVGEFLVGI